MQEPLRREIGNLNLAKRDIGNRIWLSNSNTLIMRTASIMFVSLQEHNFHTGSGTVVYWTDSSAGADAPWLVFLPEFTADPHCSTHRRTTFRVRPAASYGTLPRMGNRGPIRLTFQWPVTLASFMPSWKQRMLQIPYSWDNRLAAIYPKRSSTSTQAKLPVSSPSIQRRLRGSTTQRGKLESCAIPRACTDPFHGRGRSRWAHGVRRQSTEGKLTCVPSWRATPSVNIWSLLRTATRCLPMPSSLIAPMISTARHFCSAGRRTALAMWKHSTASGLLARVFRLYGYRVRGITQMSTIPIS